MQEDENPCQIHIQISSTDRPGILAEVLEPVVGFDWDVLDIKQFVFNKTLYYKNEKTMCCGVRFENCL